MLLKIQIARCYYVSTYAPNFILSRCAHMGYTSHLRRIYVCVFCCCCCCFRTENKSSRDFEKSCQLAYLSANAYRNKRQGRGFWADVEVHTVQDCLSTPGSRWDQCSGQGPVRHCGDRGDIAEVMHHQTPQEHQRSSGLHQHTSAGDLWGDPRQTAGTSQCDTNV